ncbi:MAG: FAD-dependent oxidoreductase [Rhodobacteraceae bacterium]|nr:FAD-dependent oxidoreductase [Paracoccaceae bacterium]MBR9823900.1 FAD-dependent oxidoreductase [Paracoccaceae bacterium]
MPGDRIGGAPDSVVILGAGHAGSQLAVALRDKGFTGGITLVNGEAEAPYQRPPLSKAYMANGQGDALWFLKPESYVAKDIRLVAGPAISVDRADRSVTLADGTSVGYGHLVFATGTRNRPLPGPWADRGVRTLKTLRDATALRAMLDQTRSLAIIGGGFIGLELAAYANRRGIDVDIVERGPRLMARAVSEPISEHFLAQHRAAGIRVHLDTGVASLDRVGRLTRLTLDGDSHVEADLVIAAIGVTAETSLAQAAGLAVEDGILVDEQLRTEDPAISAIGDCARFPSAHADAPLRLESVQNANDHARLVAGRLTGTPATYDALPWFWSDQGADKLQIAGLPGAADRRVRRGTAESGRFTVFSFRDGRLFAAESVNMPADHMVARRLIASGGIVDADALATPENALKTFLQHRQDA